MSIKQLCMMCGNRSRHWVYAQMRRDPGFPRPVQVSKCSIAWRVREVRQYLDALPRHELSGLSGPELRAQMSKGGAA
jgi:predicted DNA-binding transcriptional regulator AlpA